MAFQLEVDHPTLRYTTKVEEASSEIFDQLGLNYFQHLRC